MGSSSSLPDVFWCCPAHSGRHSQFDDLDADDLAADGRGRGNLAGNELDGRKDWRHDSAEGVQDFMPNHDQRQLLAGTAGPSATGANPQRRPIVSPAVAPTQTKVPGSSVVARTGKGVGPDSSTGARAGSSDERPLPALLSLTAADRGLAQQTRQATIPFLPQCSDAGADSDRDGGPLPNLSQPPSPPPAQQLQQIWAGRNGLSARTSAPVVPPVAHTEGAMSVCTDGPAAPSSPRGAAFAERLSVADPAQLRTLQSLIALKTGKLHERATRERSVSSAHPGDEAAGVDGRRRQGTRKRGATATSRWRLVYSSDLHGFGHDVVKQRFAGVLSRCGSSGTDRPAGALETPGGATANAPVDLAVPNVLLVETDTTVWLSGAQQPSRATHDGLSAAATDAGAPSRQPPLLAPYHVCVGMYLPRLPEMNVKSFFRRKESFLFSYCVPVRGVPTVDGEPTTALAGLLKRSDGANVELPADGATTSEAQQQQQHPSRVRGQAHSTQPLFSPAEPGDPISDGPAHRDNGSDTDASSTSPPPSSSDRCCTPELSTRNAHARGAVEHDPFAVSDMDPGEIRLRMRRTAAVAAAMEGRDASDILDTSGRYPTVFSGERLESPTSAWGGGGGGLAAGSRASAAHEGGVSGGASFTSVSETTATHQTVSGKPTRWPRGAAALVVDEEELGGFNATHGMTHTGSTARPLPYASGGLAADDDGHSTSVKSSLGANSVRPSPSPMAAAVPGGGRTPTPPAHHHFHGHTASLVSMSFVSVSSEDVTGELQDSFSGWTASSTTSDSSADIGAEDSGAAAATGPVAPSKGFLDKVEDGAAAGGWKGPLTPPRRAHETHSRAFSSASSSSSESSDSVSSLMTPDGEPRAAGARRTHGLLAHWARKSKKLLFRTRSSAVDGGGGGGGGSGAAGAGQKKKAPQEKDAQTRAGSRGAPVLPRAPSIGVDGLASGELPSSVVLGSKRAGASSIAGRDTSSTHNDAVESSCGTHAYARRCYSRKQLMRINPLFKKKRSHQAVRRRKKLCVLPTESGAMLVWFGSINKQPAMILTEDSHRVLCHTELPIVGKDRTAFQMGSSSEADVEDDTDDVDIGFDVGSRGSRHSLNGRNGGGALVSAKSTSPWAKDGGPAAQRGDDRQSGWSVASAPGLLSPEVSEDVPLIASSSCTAVGTAPGGVRPSVLSDGRAIRHAHSHGDVFAADSFAEASDNQLTMGCSPPPLRDRTGSAGKMKGRRKSFAAFPWSSSKKKRRSASDGAAGDGRSRRHSSSKCDFSGNIVSMQICTIDSLP